MSSTAAGRRASPAAAAGRDPATPGPGLRRWTLTVAGSAVLLGVLDPGAAARVAPVVLVGGFLLGLPHGAVDHMVPFWLGLRRGPVRLLVLLLGYVAIAALAWLALVRHGAATLPLLLGLSVLHFGAADAVVTPVAKARSRRWSALALVLAVGARGGPAVAGPLLAWPEVTSRALAAIDPAAAQLLLALRGVVVGVVAACVAGHLVLAFTARDRLAAAETLAVAALFTVLPPLAAFGVYFGAWHGVRHTARLLAEDPRNAADLEAGRWGPPVRRFVRTAAAPTLAALTAVVVLVALARSQDRLTAPLFSVLLALTVPHVVVVAALDLVTLRRAGHHPPRLGSAATTPGRV